MATLLTCTRINLGGYHSTDYMQKLMQAKYPAHRAAVTFDRATVIICSLSIIANQELKEEHTYVAIDYIEELESFAAGNCDVSALMWQTKTTLRHIFANFRLYPKLLRSYQRRNSKEDTSYVSSKD